MIALVPTPQRPMIATPHSAKSGSWNQFGGSSIPMLRRNWFTAPRSLLSRVNQSTAMATPESTAGT